MNYEDLNEEQKYQVQELIDNNTPAWVEGVDYNDLQSITQGGCASGAYMPAVTYYQALQTMGEHGDGVLQYIEDTLGEIPYPKSGESWSGIAVHYLSMAVGLWAGSMIEQADELMEGFEE